MYDQVLYSPQQQQQQVVYLPAPQGQGPAPQGPSPYGNGHYAPPQYYGPPMSPMGPMGHMGPMGPMNMQPHYYDPRPRGSQTYVAVHRNDGSEYAERQVSMTSAEDELAGLSAVIKDFGKQMSEATLKVRRQNQSQTQSRAAMILPFRKMEGPRSTAATNEKLHVMVPKKPGNALDLVQRLVGMLSSKLVPTIAYERQGSITYVLSMIETYIRHIRSLLTGEVVEREEEEEEDDETTRSLTYALRCVEAAAISIPSSIGENDAHMQMARKIEARCDEIRGKIENASQERVQTHGSTQTHAHVAHSVQLGARTDMAPQRR